MTSPFKKAERSQVKLKIGVQGPSGSGKTMGSLSLGRAVAASVSGRVAVIDSERKRSAYYADRYDFDVLELTDHKPESYIAAIDAAVEAGYPVVVIDSLAHAWQSVNAEKEDYDRANPRSNSWTNWRIFGPRWEKLIRHILDVPVHVICTMRSKQAYEQVEQNGRKQVVKLGLQPEVRSGSEYELALVFDVSNTHKAEATKDNTGLFEGKQVDLCSPSVATALLEWISTAKPVALATPEQRSKLQVLADAEGVPAAWVERINTLLTSQLTAEKAQTAIDTITAQLKEKANVA